MFIHPPSTNPSGPAVDLIDHAPQACSHEGQEPAATTCVEGDAFAILHHCHEHIGEQLQRLEGLAAALRGRETFLDEQRVALEEIVSFLETAVPVHTADEEQTLFPALRAQPEFADVPHTPMDCMEGEHLTHLEMRRELADAVTRRDARATILAARRLIAEYRDHIAKEEEVLYPFAKRLLTDPATLASLAADMRFRRRSIDLWNAQVPNNDSGINTRSPRPSTTTNFPARCCARTMFSKLISPTTIPPRLRSSINSINSS